MWQSFGFAIQLGLSVFVDSLVAKTAILCVLIVISVASVLYMDSSVQPLDYQQPRSSHGLRSDDESSDSLLAKA